MGTIAWNNFNGISEIYRDYNIMFMIPKFIDGKFVMESKENILNIFV